MAHKHILHMLTPLKHMSPFDVNMALDAGFDAVVPYVGVSLDDVTGLVQDAIFSRPPDAGADTANVHPRVRASRRGHSKLMTSRRCAGPACR